MVNVGHTYTVTGGAGKDVGEVIILDGKKPMPANLPLSKLPAPERSLPLRRKHCIAQCLVDLAFSETLIPARISYSGALDFADI